MTRPIDRDDPPARGEPSHQRRPVGRIAHPAVDQQERFAGACRCLLRPAVALVIGASFEVTG